MEEARAQIVRVITEHLEEILDRLMQAYAAEIPRVADAKPEELRIIREAARRTTMSFLSIYSGGSREAFDEARRVTIARAGELFERDEIIAMLRVANQVMFQSARALVEREAGIDASRESQVEQALEGFIAELEQAGQLIPTGDAALGELLSSAETEEPDIR